MKKILVLGGYGATGKILCKHLIENIEAEIIIAGRRKKVAESFQQKLSLEFPFTEISVREVDASSLDSLQSGFKDIDIVIIASTTLQCSENIIDVALSEGVDYIDLYFQDANYALLEKKKNHILDRHLCFVTLAGFHPGLPAVFIRKGSQFFDEYVEANIFMMMNFRASNADSLLEIVDVIGDSHPEIYEDGRWKKPTSRDYRKFIFGNEKKGRWTFPIQMIEIRNLSKILGLKKAGIYIAGFNWFADYIITPLIMVSYKIRKGMLRRLWAKMLHWSINSFLKEPEGVFLVLEGKGKLGGIDNIVRIEAFHDNPYEMTAIPVVAMVNQLLNGNARTSGLHIMGEIADPTLLFEDMIKMGMDIRIDGKPISISDPMPFI